MMETEQPRSGRFLGSDAATGEHSEAGHMTNRRIALGLSLLVLIGIGRTLHAQTKSRSVAGDQRWAAIRHVFGNDGESHDGYFRINLPRSDLHVRIDSDTLESSFEFTSYVGFVPVGKNDVLAMGEYVLRDDEVASVMSELRRQGIPTPALHNHLVRESPRIMYIHVLARGPAASVAAKLKAAFGKSASPLEPAAEQPSTVDWSAVDAILGKHSEAKSRTVEYESPRRERLAIDGVAVKSSGMLETASEVVFQQLGTGRAACGGELFVSLKEIDAVAHSLDEHGLHVTAIHNHMVAQSPPMYWIHWYGTGDVAILARGVAAALGHTSGAHKSKSED